MGITVRTRPGNRIAVTVSQQKEVKTINKTVSPNRLSKLYDVDASDADNNETLVYDEASGNFVVKELPIINGGTF